jgi:peptide/nickel transport system substrate-binding protein
VDAIGRVEKAGAAVWCRSLRKNFGFPYIVFNTKEGVMATRPCAVPFRPRAGPGEMLAGGFWRQPVSLSWSRTSSPRAHRYYSAAGAELYNQRNPHCMGKDLAAKAGYSGQPIRIMASRQYEFHYNMALVMAEQLKKAGFKTDLQVVDWATLVQRRNDSEVLGCLLHPFGLFPEPMLSPPQIG